MCIYISLSLALKVKSLVASEIYNSPKRKTSYLGQKMSTGPFLLFVALSVLISAQSKALMIMTNNDGSENHKSCSSVLARIGCVIDYTSRVGKEQRIAIEMAVQDHVFIDSSSSSFCAKLDLIIKDSQGNPARATTRGNNYSI